MYSTKQDKTKTEFQEIKRKHETVMEEITAISSAGEQLKSVLEKFDQKLLQYYNTLKNVDLVPDNEILSTDKLEEMKNRTELRTKVLRIDFDKIYENMTLIYDAIEAIKPAREKAEKLEKMVSKNVKNYVALHKRRPKEAYDMVDFSVKRYMDRGFQNLMVSFGCTGGQHRSVYAAEKMAQHINEKYGVEVQLIHREQNIERVLNRKD